MKLNSILIKIFLLLSTTLSTQTTTNNLVLNPSFEEDSKVFPVKPCEFVRINTSFDKCMPFWNTFQGQTPDIVQWEEERENPCVYPQPRTGERMIGFINYLPHDDINMPRDFHEFLQGSFRQPLEVGKEYQFQFYLTQPAMTANFHLKRVYGRITTAVPVGVNNLGFYFLEEPLEITTDMWQYIETNNIKPHFNIEKIIETADGEWIQLTGTFTADKAYNHFLFGNFYPDAETQNTLSEEEKVKIADFPTLYYMEEKKRVAYYCIDDFGIYLADEAPTFQVANQLKEKGIYTFKNLNFESGKWDLQPEAVTELDGLVEYLKENTLVNIEIAGHTDNEGTTDSNQILSENRAKTVADYLSQKGIDEKRLQYKGYGESNPKSTNETAEGRLVNRRVECIVRK